MLKTLLLAIAAVLLVLPAQAQDYPIDQGSFVFGGSVSYQSQGGDGFDGEPVEERQTNLTVNPFFLLFVMEGIGAGGEIFVARISDNGTTQTAYGIGPTLGYFFGSEESSVYPFVSATPVYLRSNFSFPNGADASTDGLGLRLNGGAAVMLAANAAVTLGIFYQLDRLSADNLEQTVNTNTFGLTMGVTAFVY